MALDDDWMLDAACVGVPDVVFFPKSNKKQKADYTAAKTICNTCPVRNTCLAWSIVHSIPYGCWGGLDPTERKQIPRAIKVRFKRAWWAQHPLARPGRRMASGGR
jgi:WhiB family redox-sensing transcriptional regulator